MINFGDLYSVLTAVVPLYVTMFLAYASVKWNIFSPQQCGGINRFVAIFAVPLLSFEFISRINPYKMNLKFIAADGVSKVLTLIVLFLWTNLSKKGSLDWAITMFSLSTLPNTLVMGIPLLKSMYGDDKESIMVQAVVLQCIIWYTLLLFLFEYREAKNLILTAYEKDSSNGSISSSNNSNSQRNEGSFREGQERVERSTCNEDDIVNVILSTPSNPHMLQNLNRVAPALASAVEDDKRELHLFIWRCRCCTSPGVCEQSIEVCSRENEKAESMEDLNTIRSPGSPEMLKKILKMVCFKLVKNPNSYASILGLSWALASCRWGIKKPQILENSVTILSDAGLGMAMFSLGLFMASQPKLIACGNRLAAYGMVARFVAGPAVMAVASIAVGLRGTILQVSIVQASLPQGIVPFVFSREYNLHPDVLSTAVIFGMIISLPITMLYYILLGL
ncbi:probable auxin efflux carrier component 1d [Cynara cardunculus var. scolymus]|uniref:probable auxin efflux carrier component 1d n=1 Tax=Cynara cardunculus var. scolymus TaxID=59895 RepID=UPI000D6254E4|nr:probable auxin efflux carrier component 1d [Cynara cardunculus var. scolymus]